MEQPCYKCGQVVDEGRPFCPHCAAPQIRVIVAQPISAPLLAEGAADSKVPLPASQTVPVLAVPMQWSQSAQPAALAGLIAAVLMVLKLMVPLIAVIAAGFLAVALYRRRNPEIEVGARAGARLGALCGLLCSGMTTILAAVRVGIMHEGAEVRNTLLESVRQSAVRYPDPQYQSALDFMRSPAGLGLMMVFLLILGVVMFMLLGGLGGAVGGALLGRRGRT